MGCSEAVPNVCPVPFRLYGITNVVWVGRKVGQIDPLSTVVYIPSDSWPCEVEGTDVGETEDSIPRFMSVVSEVRLPGQPTLLRWSLPRPWLRFALDGASVVYQGNRVAPCRQISTDGGAMGDS